MRPVRTASVVLSVLSFLGAMAAPAYAQNVTFAGSQTTIPASGLYAPNGVAVDRAGDVFIADPWHSRVVEVAANGGAQTTVGSGLSSPNGVAVDGASDLFIADTGNNRVVEVPYLGGGVYGAQTTVPASGLSFPYGVAVDGAGDVFIADFSNSRVVEVPYLGNGTYGVQITVPANGLNQPVGVAVDGAGDIFIADNSNSRVVEVPAGGGPQTTVGNGLGSANGVAVDGAGDVFISDGSNSRVVEVPAAGGAQITVVSGLIFPMGVAVDGAGDVFVADYTPQVLKVQRIAVNFGNVNVCPAGQTAPAPCNATLTLNYNVAATTTFGTTKVVTQGAPNLDFTLASGSTCTSIVTAGSACTVNVTFAPRAPGERMGAVQLVDSSGNLLATTMIHGIGQGPAIAFGPGTQTTVGSGLSYPYGAAVDAAGDVFIADYNNSRVVEVPAGGGPQITVGSGLILPTDGAVDGTGDVFIADGFNNEVVEVPAGCTSPNCQTTVGSGLSRPYGVGVDGAGDVFIADGYINEVVEVPAGCASPDCQTTVGNGLNQPDGVAVDGGGDVFIVDNGNNRIVEVPAGGGPQTTVWATGLSGPSSVAVDAAGDVFIADGNSNRVVEVPTGCGTPSCQITVASGLRAPSGVAVDGAGDIFIVDTGHSHVLEVQSTLPPSLSFESTPVGNTSNPQSVTIQNIGNQTLNAVTPGLGVTGPNFAQVAGSGTPADCTTSFALTPGASCNLSISFEPQSVGNLSSTATFTDNTLNTTPSASQSITLQGTGTPNTVNVAVGTSPAGLAFSVDGTAYTSAQNFAWTIGSSHAIATTSPQTPTTGVQDTFASWSDGGALSHSVTAAAATTTYTATFNTAYLLTTAANPTAGGSVTPASGTYYAPGTVVSLTATANTGYKFSNWTGSVANANSASTTVTMSAPETVTGNFVPSIAPSTTALVSSLNPSTQAGSVTFAATVSSSASTRTGTVQFFNGTALLGIAAVSSNTAKLITTQLPAGSDAITAVYSGDANNSGSTSNTVNQVVKAPTTTTLISSPNASVYGQAAVFTAVVSSPNGAPPNGELVTFKQGSTVLGTGTLTGGVAMLSTAALGAGLKTVTAVYAGDANSVTSTSEILSQVVVEAPTTTTLASSVNPSTYKQSVAFTATVASSSSGTVSGTVTFYDGATTLGTATISGGTAKYTTSALVSGTHNITAMYNGSTSFNGSLAALTQIVN